MEKSTVLRNSNQTPHHKGRISRSNKVNCHYNPDLPRTEGLGLTIDRCISHAFGINTHILVIRVQNIGMELTYLVVYLEQ